MQFKRHLYFFLGDITLPNDIMWSDRYNVLTCISTGGPATNVTWTMTTAQAGSSDNDMITPTTVLLNEVDNPQVTVLDDAHNAQYIHNIAVMEPSDSFHYSCSVSNNKPSSAKSVITLVGNGML